MEKSVSYRQYILDLQNSGKLDELQQIVDDLTADAVALGGKISAIMAPARKKCEVFVEKLVPIQKKLTFAKAGLTFLKSDDIVTDQDPL